MTALSALYSVDGLSVETYDTRIGADETGPIAGDVAFYAELARESGSRVLELACGTGRVSWRLAAAGFEVTGLDLSAPMLSQAEAKRTQQPGEAQKRMRFVDADMTDYDLSGLFDLVICPFRAFQSLLSPESQRQALDCAFAHLRPGGRLALHLFDPRLDWLIVEGAAPLARTSVGHPLRATTVEFAITERRSDPLQQVTEEHWLYRELDAAGVVVQEQHCSLRLRWSYRWEMRYLLTLAGFVVEAEYSNFNRAPPAYGREQIWVARRP